MTRSRTSWRHADRTRQPGFTLIEVMIVVAVIGILAAIAYPSYSEHVKRGNRTEGQALLTDTAARQERYYNQNNAYVTTSANIGKLGMNLTDTNKSATGKYQLTLAERVTGKGYKLTATPTFSDARCTTLTLDDTGARGYTGSAGSVNDCWR